ncbi:MAG TPA: hypothetical protein VII75_12375 [Thermoanaerobaculia bacterium]|nr:hypothetical protein [Thermoanaerobaculia bacterium]
MKRTLFLFALLCIVPAAFAGDGTSIVFASRAAGLPPGTHVRLELTAAYQLVQMPEIDKNAKGGMRTLEIPAENLRYHLEADKPLVWEFTVGPDGKAPQPEFRLNFSRRLLAPPAGMLAEVLFPTRYTVTLPGAKPVTKQSQFGMQIERDSGPTIARCVRVKGGPDGGFGVGVLPACDANPAANGHVIRQ